MLVLTRRVSDQILVPSLGITLEVLAIKGNVVKLGISAPQEVRILRGELSGTPPTFTLKAPEATPSRSDATETIGLSGISSARKRRAGPLGSCLRKTESSSASAMPVCKKISSKSVHYCTDDSAESVSESKAFYEVCT